MMGGKKRHYETFKGIKNVLQQVHPGKGISSSAYNLVKDNLTWQGYGIDSINTFLCDVHDIQNKKKLPKDFEGLRPTFKESLFSTAVIEAANKSISQQNNWITLKI